VEKVTDNRKFRETVEHTTFLQLSDEDRNQIESYATQFRLSVSDIRNLVDWFTDLTMWQVSQDERNRIWSDEQPASRKHLMGILRARYDRYRTMPVSYQPDSDTAKINQNGLRFESLPKDDKVLGMCPVASEKTRCCNLMTIDAVRNCGFGCSYCSIQTFFGANDTIAFDENLASKLDRVELDSDKRYHIGSGQASDSLIWGNRAGILEALMRFASRNPNVILELKTKSRNVSWLLRNETPENLFCTWSLNTPSVIQNEEHGTANLDERLRAARKVADKGILVGFHFHPIVDYEGGEAEYGEVIRRVVSMFNPSEVGFVSLGTLTFIKPVLKQLKNELRTTQITRFGMESAAGKLSYPLATKERIFKNVFRHFSPWKNDRNTSSRSTRRPACSTRRSRRARPTRST
jgi:spore photoproduct lyase